MHGVIECFFFTLLLSVGTGTLAPRRDPGLVYRTRAVSDESSAAPSLWREGYMHACMDVHESDANGNFNRTSEPLNPKDLNMRLEHLWLNQ